MAFWFLIQLFLKYIKDIPFDTTSSSYVIPNPGVLEDLGFEVYDEDDFELAFIGDDFVLGVDDLVLEDDELVLDLFEVGRKIVFKLHSRKYYS